MPEVKKMSPEEINEIKSLQSRYNQTIFEIGASEAQLLVFQEQITKLSEIKKGLVADLKSIEAKEMELTNKLTEKYGEGKIDIENGEITIA